MKMFKKVKDFFFNEKIKNMHINDFPIFLLNLYKNKNDFDKYDGFINFIKNTKLDYEDKRIHEFLWFNQLSVELKIKMLTMHKNFYDNDSRVHYFFNVEKNEEVKENILIGYIESKRYWLEEYSRGNYYSCGKKSGLFRIEDLSGNISGELIQSHIKKNGKIYFDFVTDIKNKNTDSYEYKRETKKFTDEEESVYYKVYYDIAYQNDSILKEKSEYVPYLILSDFKINENNEDFIKLLECFIVFDNPAEYRRMMHNLKGWPKLKVFYESCLLKNKLSNSLNNSEEEPTIKRKRL